MADQSYFWVKHSAKTTETYTLSDGRTVTLKPGMTWHPKSETPACDIIDMLVSKPENFRARTKTELRSLFDAGVREGCLPKGFVHPELGVEPSPGQTSQPVPAKPPAEGDSALAQGAPSVDVQKIVGADVVSSDEPLPEPRPGAPHATHSGEEPRHKTQGGDPVDLFLGALSWEEEDLAIPGTRIPLALVRRYRSGPPHRGPLGWNWDHNHNVFLREMENGDVARWNGALHEDIFRKGGQGYAPPRGVFEVLSAVPGSPKTYEISCAGRIVHRFERPPGWGDPERVPLVHTRDRYGNRLDYSYTSTDQVSRVRDDLGRFIAFSYNCDDLLAMVADHSGRQVIYEYESFRAHLTCIRFPPTLGHPLGISKGFSYDSFKTAPDLQHNMTRVEDGAGRTYMEISYEEDPAVWHYGCVIRQLIGDYEYRYRYTQLQWVPPLSEFVNMPCLRVEVAAPDGGVTSYTFNFRGDLLDHRQRLSRDGSYRVVIWRYSYDEQGNLASEVRPDGSQEIWVHDCVNLDPRARGNLIRRELRSAPVHPAPSRVVWHAKYDPVFQLILEERVEGGATTTYRYDSNGLPTSGEGGHLREIAQPPATLSDGAVQNSVTRFETIARGDVRAIVAASGTREEFEYGTVGNGKGRLVLQRHDSNGLRIEERFDYDSVGYVSSVTDGTGATHRLVANAFGQVIRRSSAPVDGSTSDVLSHFDCDGRITAVERPRGSFAEPGFSEETILDAIERDALGHPRAIALGANTSSRRDIKVCSDFRGMPLRILDATGTMILNRFDERGLLILQEVIGDDGTRTATRFIRDANGRLVKKIEGPDEDLVTGYRYDGFGRLSRVDFPNGSTMRFSWGIRDLLSDVMIMGDPGNGNRRLLCHSHYDHDERGRVTRKTDYAFRTDPASAIPLTTEHLYDSSNRLIQTTCPRGGVTLYRYNSIGCLASRVGPEGNEQHYVFDVAGRPVELLLQDREPQGDVVRKWEMEYDQRGRLIRTIDPGGAETSIELDDRNLPVRCVEPGGVVRERVFGAFGELLCDVLDPGGLDIRNAWTYDELGRPLSYIDPTGEITRFVHDGIGRHVRTEPPNGAIISRVFGRDGRLETESLSSGTKLRFKYDAAARLNLVESAAGTGVTAVDGCKYQYDGLDRVVRAETGDHVIERGFDSLGRLIRESSHGVSLETHYDDLAGSEERRWPDGRREVIETNLNGLGTRVTRTSAGSLGDGQPLLGSFSPSGERHFGTAQLQGGVAVEARYDCRKRPAFMEYKSALAVLDELSYWYDARSRRRIERLISVPALTRYYEFDSRDRLISMDDGLPIACAVAFDQAEHDIAIGDTAAHAGGVSRHVSFTHDASDARIQCTETGLPDVNYAYGVGHQAVTAGGEVFAYHADGTRVSDSRRTLSLDALGRVTAVVVGGASALRIDYDALGRPCTLQQGAGSPILLSYFGDTLLQESQGGTPIRQVTPHPMRGGTLAVHVTGSTYYTCYDAGLNLITTLDSAGHPVERYRYEPFGAPSVFDSNGVSRPVSVTDIPVVFGGMRYVPEVGLYLAMRRLMDPDHGVYLEPDPLGYMDSPNLYAYAAQDPVNLVDPTGELFFLGVLAIMGVGALVAGSLNAARQGIQIAEGSRRGGGSFWELGLSVGIGAAVAPLLVAAPEVAALLAVLGVASGVEEWSRANYATAGFDFATSLLPFAARRVRTSVLGPGTRIGQMRGLGRAASWSERAGRFNEIGQAMQTLGARVWNERFHHGTTLESAEFAVRDIDSHLQMVRIAQEFPGARHEGPGLYFGRPSSDPSVQGTPMWWARQGGSTRRPGSPAVLEASIPRWRMMSLRREPGVKVDIPQEGFPGSPQTFFPFEGPAHRPSGPAVQFGQHASWRIVDPLAPDYSLHTLRPLLHSQPFRTPDSEEESLRRERSTAPLEQEGVSGDRATGQLGTKKQ